jgi:PIN domain nuclease of toxin-antitoxin system
MPALLLDTHAFLWWCEGSRELSPGARKAMAREECHVSVASLWEIAIKSSLGKLKLPLPFERYVPEQMQLNGFTQLEIGFRHVAACANLPWHHRDPFDRLLAVQATHEGLTMVSRDPMFERYGVQRIW